MGDVSLSKASKSDGAGYYVVDRDTGVTMGIVHRVERRYTMFVQPRTVVEWDPIAWLPGQAPWPGPAHTSRGAAVAWIKERFEKISPQLASPDTSFMDSLVDRCTKATGVYSADVDAILAWLIEQSGNTHICPVCQQGT